MWTFDMNMCTHKYIHTLCMHCIHSLHTHTHTRMHTQRNEKQYPEKGGVLIWAIKRGKKWKIIIILPESEEITVLIAELMLTRDIVGLNWCQKVTSEEINILSSVGSLMSPSETFGLIFSPPPEHRPKSLTPSITLTICDHNNFIQFIFHLQSEISASIHDDNSFSLSLGIVIGV